MSEELKEKQELKENPETPEEGDKEEVEKTPEELKAENEQLEKDKKGLTEQLIVERKKKQEAIALARGKKDPEDPEKSKEEEGKDVEATVKKVLDEDKEERRKTNQLKALHKFWEKNPEFNPENDSSGIKMDIVNESLKRLNTVNSIEVDDILKDYSDVLKLIKKDESSEVDVQLDTSIGRQSKTIKGKKSSLTPEQEKLRKEKGWTVEKYLDMKAKHPTVVT